MKAIWSGFISFGLVSIPVKMYVAIKDTRIHFNQIHEKTKARIRYKRTVPESVPGSDQFHESATEPREVHSHEIIKGYNIGADQYITFKPEEIEDLAPKQSRTIAVSDFVDLMEIDPIFFDKSYYLLPEKQGGRAYTLFRTALSKTGKVGIAKFMFRSKEHLALLRPYQDIISVQTIHYFEELASVKSLSPQYDPAEVVEKELKLAEALIGSLSERFEPEKYQDEHTAKIRELIQRRLEERESIIEAPAVSTGEKVQNLLSALEKSLEQTAQERKKEKSAGKKKLKVVRH